MTAHLKTYITDLNNLAYADALTSVHNKGAFDLYTAKMQAEMDVSGEKPEFAICIFDCNNLNSINTATIQLPKTKTSNRNIPLVKPLKEILLCVLGKCQKTACAG
ncbi:MAG: hypothetical protein IJI71_12275 [Clostridia bacterium]|nr:hypothetical protein [Clostridia bacterium]